jgi:acyl-CoA thioesterase-1
LGDSLTAGYGLKEPDTESVLALIQQRIIDENLDFKVYNGGLSGGTSTNGLYRVDHWLRRPIDVFVLELGINDFIRQVPLTTTKSNLEKIVQKVKEKNPH